MDKINFYNLCRICLKDSQSYSNIFQEHLMNGCFVYEILNDVYDLHISPVDGLPEFVCVQCLPTIKQFTLFVRKVHKGGLALTHLKRKMEKSKSGPILLMSEVLSFQRDVDAQEEVTESGTSEYSSTTVDPTPPNAEVITTDLITSEITIKEDTLEEELIDSEEFGILGRFDLTTMLMQDSPQVTIKPEEVIIDSSSNKVSEYPVKETEVTIQPEEVTIASNSKEITEDPAKGNEAIIKFEEVIIYSSPDDESDDHLEETEESHRPILLKHEVLPFSRGSHPQEELIDSEAIWNLNTVELTTRLMQDSPQVQLTAVDLITKPHNLHCLEHSRPHCTSVKAIGADLCTRNIDTVDESIFDKSKNISSSENVEASSSGTMQRLEGQRSIPGGGVCMDPVIQEGIDISVEVAEERGSKEVNGVKEHRRPHCTSVGAVGADLCTRNISTIDESIFVKSKNIPSNENVEASTSGTMQSLEGQRIIPGGSVFMDPLIQEGIDISVEVAEERGSMEVNEVKKRRRGMKGDKEQFGCYHCGNVCMSKRGLMRHMRSHGFRVTYDCDVCGKVFKTSYKLKMHVLCHTRSKPYKCEKCSKCFLRNIGLKLHLRLHMESRPFKCVECSYYFSNSSNLKKHMRLHTGSKPYKCAECSKSFSDGSYFKKHMTMHTGLKTYECAECSKCFIDSRRLKLHMQIHKGSKP